MSILSKRLVDPDGVVENAREALAFVEDALSAACAEIVAPETKPFVPVYGSNANVPMYCPAVVVAGVVIVPHPPPMRISGPQLEPSRRSWKPPVSVSFM
jgi:hypothetical protein